VAFGNEASDYRTPLDSFLVVVAAFYGDWDRDSMIAADVLSEGLYLGSTLWIATTIVGLALLSNIFIAVVGAVYDEVLDDMEPVRSRSETIDGYSLAPWFLTNRCMVACRHHRRGSRRSRSS
tara:strand:- start:870 stop:1235 length:366 start_codon:yes stop_codon:yes gene_type:complete